MKAKFLKGKIEITPETDLETRFLKIIAKDYSHFYMKTDDSIEFQVNIKD